MNAQESTTTRPYLIRALHEWCTDNGFTPYLAVRVDDSVQVPREYVKDGEIVLNVGLDATGGLLLGNDFIALVKDSSLVSVLGVADITQMGKVYASGSFRFFETYSIVAYVYLILTIGLSLALRGVERRMRRSNR